MNTYYLSIIQVETMHNTWGMEEVVTFMKIMNKFSMFLTLSGREGAFLQDLAIWQIE